MAALAAGAIVIGLLVYLVVSRIIAGQTGPQRIVFIDNDGNVATVSVDGEDVQTLTDDAEDDYIGYMKPRWSPNHRWLAAFRGEGEDISLWIADADGKNARDIAVDCIAYDLAWSPDSRNIAWACQSGQGEPAGLCVVDVSKDVAKLVTEGNDHVVTASWTPDGRLAYTVVYEAMSADEMSARIYTCRADGTDVREFPVDSNEEIVVFPVFAMQGDRMSYYAFIQEPNTNRRYVAHGDGSGAELIAEMPENSWDTVTAEWSPDGSLLLFRNQENEYSLYDARSGRITTIAALAALQEAGTYVLNCTFLGNSQQLVCSDGAKTIIIVDLLKGSTRTLTEGHQPDW